MLFQKKNPEKHGGEHGENGEKDSANFLLWHR